MLHLTRIIRTLCVSSARQSPEGTLELAEILQLAPEELSQIRMGKRYHYRPFAIPKRDGRERRILAPSLALKTLQRRLLDRYLSRLPVHPAATAFVRGRSVAVNAKRHVGHVVIATADIRDFFSSTSAHRVRCFFLKMGWRGDALGVLMRLCVYRDGLPQGAPTSPYLSNLVNVDLDEALTALARRSGATYTRYGDDLAFSWPTGRVPTYFERSVRKHLLEAGYSIQPHKGWRVRSRAGEPELNGVVLGRDGRLRAPAYVRRRMRVLRRRTRRRGDVRARRRLHGYEGYVHDLRS